jgi:hypothetical protein
MFQSESGPAIKQKRKEKFEYCVKKKMIKNIFNDFDIFFLKKIWSKKFEYFECKKIFLPTCSVLEELK